MFRLKKGALRTIVYNENDLNSYKLAGWSLVEDKPKKEVKEEKKEEVKDKVVEEVKEKDEQNKANSKSDKK